MSVFQGRKYAFADDLLIFFDAHNSRQIKNAFETVKRFLANWLRSAGLSLSLEKTTAMQFSGEKIAMSELKLMGHVLTNADEMKYLGVMLNSRLNLRAHIEYLQKKLAKLTNATGWFLRSTSTLTLKEKLKVYPAVFLPTALYASEIWFAELEIKKYKDMLNRSQRAYLLAITNLYRTTSNRKIYKMLNIISLELEVYKKQTRLIGQRCDSDREADSDLDEALMEENNKQFPGELEVQIDRSLHEHLLSSYTTEVGIVITGHGPMNAYLYRFGLREDDLCRFCMEETENTAHFIEGCPGQDFKLIGAINTVKDLDEFIENSAKLIERIRVNAFFE